MLPAMKMTEPYSPATGEGEREAGQERRHDRRQDDAAEGLPAPGAERRRGLLDLGVEILQDRPDRAHHERQADEDQRHDDAKLGERDLEAERLENCPTQPLPAYSAVSAMPATAVGRANGRSIRESTIRRPGKS